MRQVSINTKLENVAKEIISDLPKIQNNKLWDGKAGIALFLYEFAVHTKNKEYEEIAFNLLVHLVHEVYSKGGRYSPCELAAIAWSIKSLMHHARIRDYFTDKLPDVEFFLFNNCCNEECYNDNFPILLPAIYLLSKGKNELISCEPYFIDSLFNFCTYNLLTVHDDKTNVLSMTNSMLYFLMEARKYGIHTWRCDKLLWRILMRLSYSEMMHNDYGDLFVLRSYWIKLIAVQQ